MKAPRVHLFLLALLVLLILPPTLQAQDQNRAALVVDFGGQVTTQCVSFSEPQISGYELLVRAGLNVEIEAGGMGAAVCRLNETGCPANDCFCQCEGGDDCVYWSYWHRTGDAWQYSPVGASAYQVQNGSVDGWSWGPGSPDQAIPPPNLTFADVCATAATATPMPTSTLPPPTETSPPPSATPLASPTSPPSVNFSADAQQIVAGSCTTLRWNVQHVQAVYLDDAGVMGQGTQRVCPTAPQTYTLRAVHGGGETVRQVTVNVTTATLAATATVPAAPTATSPPANVAAVTATPTATSAPAISATPSPAVTETEAGAVVAPETTTATPPSLPTATVTAIVVTAPPRPTAAPAGAAAAVAAAQPPTPAPTTSAGSAVAPSGPDTPWLSYAGFAALVVALGVALVVAQRGKEAG